MEEAPRGAAGTVDRKMEEGHTLPEFQDKDSLAGGTEKSGNVSEGTQRF